MQSEARQHVIDVDASGWRRRADLYSTVLPLLGAPEWHGGNANALVESMVWGEINAQEPPYTLRFHGTADLPVDVAEELGWVRDDLAKARAEFQMRRGQDVAVDIEIVS